LSRRATSSGTSSPTLADTTGAQPTGAQPTGAQPTGAQPTGAQPAEDVRAAASGGTRTVAILADDLIWATRLADAIRVAGGSPRVVRRLVDLEALVRAPSGAAEAANVLIDLSARAYDGVAAVRLASSAGARVVAVGQHDDAALRQAATEAGASRVFTYRALFEDGPGRLAKWLAA
jgi:hypothetical protein